MKIDQMPGDERALRRVTAGKGLSRREFLERAAALGVGVATASAIWTRNAAAARKKGGHVRVGVDGGSTTDTLDITWSTGATHSQTMLETLRNKLVDYTKTEDGRVGLEADLATEWWHSDKGKRWTFRLRQGVEFHNGKTLTARDVIDSMNLHRGEDTTSGGASMMKIVTDISADGDDVIFDLSEPAADFAYYLGQNVFGIGPSRDGVVDQSGVGTGPFILEDFEPGIRGAGRRNPNYFKEGKPYFDSFELLSVNDLPALSTGLRTGEFDVIPPVDPKRAARLDAEPGIRVVSVSGGSTITMPMHADKTPFDSVDFRLAMKYAVDRAELRDKIYRGHASLANDHPVPPFDQFYNADIPQRDYDPDKARFHLKKSGHEGTKIRIHASGAVTGSIDAGVLYAESARRAGIDLEVVQEPVDGYWANVWAKVPFCYCWWGARPTPDVILTLAYICGAAWGDTNWCDERFTNLVAEARVELDPVKRKELYNEIQWILHDQGSTVVPVFQSWVHGISDRIDTGDDLMGAHPLDTYRAFEKWSFKT